jgi:hypothetical protein
VKASITFPAAVAWAIDGRPRRVVPCTYRCVGTKSGYRKRRRLVDFGDESLEMRPGDEANVEPREHRLRELDDADAEPVPAGLRHALHEPRLDEAAELAGHRARRRPDPARELVRAELAAVRERVDDREPAAERRHPLPGRLTGPGHAR